MKILITKKTELISQIPTTELWDILIELGWKYCEYCNKLIDADNEGWDYEHNCCLDCATKGISDNPAELTNEELLQTDITDYTGDKE